jgi:hypothetical protein
MRATTYYSLPAWLRAALPAPTTESILARYRRDVQDLGMVAAAAHNARYRNERRISDLQFENAVLATEAEQAFAAARALSAIGGATEYVDEPKGGTPPKEVG